MLQGCLSQISCNLLTPIKSLANSTLHLEFSAKSGMEKIMLQAGKNTAATMKEKASNTDASTKSGTEKTKAKVQEKVERVTAHGPWQKERATERKESRINEAESYKQEKHEENAAATQQARGVGARAGVQHGEVRDTVIATRDVSYI